MAMENARIHTERMNQALCDSVTAHMIIKFMYKGGTIKIFLFFSSKYFLHFQIALVFLEVSTVGFSQVCRWIQNISCQS